MADTEREYPLGFIDKRRTQATNNSGLARAVNDYHDVNALRISLSGANAYYTSKVLDGMTKNDMVYALRTISDAAGI